MVSERFLRYVEGSAIFWDYLDRAVTAGRARVEPGDRYFVNGKGPLSPHGAVTLLQELDNG